jgi:hypothetical protein
MQGVRRLHAVRQARGPGTCDAVHKVHSQTYRNGALL